MSRLTGKEAFGLMEAYQAVYAPRELTEEQVWEGVENWVQSLLEEGYDLSDYTWNEMYENYIISEQQGILDRAIDAGAEVIKKPIENFANKKVGGIPGALGIPGAVAGQQVDQTAQQLKNKDFGGAFKTVAGGVQSLMQSHDLYDTILEYLISEGYADTNENALVIMANMSEDWKYSILEDVRGGPSFPSSSIIDPVRTIVGGILDRYRNRNGSPKEPNIPQKPVPNSGPVLRDEPLWDGPDGLPTKPQPKPKPGPVLRNEPLF